MQTPEKLDGMEVDPSVTSQAAVARAGYRCGMYDPSLIAIADESRMAVSKRRHSWGE